MGIVNVTPDSYSDGGVHFDPDRAVEHGLRLASDGADILDVGGESTRPGAAEVPAEEELRRVLPVIRGLAARCGIPVSVDTRKAAVAEGALEAGASIVNDVSALVHDPEMTATVLRAGAGVVLMHMQGTPADMQNAPCYGDVVDEVAGWLKARMKCAVEAGLDPETLCLDPGIGFGKKPEHNISLLGGLDRFVRLGRPVLIGLSRKSIVGILTGRGTSERLAGSLAGAVFAAMRGAHILRVHDVRETRDAVAVVSALAGLPDDSG